MEKGFIMYKFKKNESGNVLFLILIAVALFAALSYAVTQSTRSGGGSADRERSILSSASLTQGPTALRTSLIRMVLGGTDVSNMRFNAPANFGSVDEATLVFHPNGGGAVFQRAPADVMADGDQGTWFYNPNFTIPEIGIDTAGVGNDVIAFLPGITQGVCSQINDEFAIDATGCTPLNGNIPLLDSGSDETEIAVNYEDGDTFPSTAEVLQGDSCTALTGQPSGCFYHTAATPVYVFYSVLLER